MGKTKTVIGLLGSVLIGSVFTVGVWQNSVADMAPAPAVMKDPSTHPFTAPAQRHSEGGATPTQTQSCFYFHGTSYCKSRENSPGIERIPKHYESSLLPLQRDGAVPSVPRAKGLWHPPALINHRS